MKLSARVALLVSITVACVGCDQVTKGIAGAYLGVRPPVALLGGTVRLSYAKNHGGFLSLGADWPEPLRSGLFVGVTLAMVVGMAVVALRRADADRAHVAGLALVIAGGLGNLIDRLTLGAVRDFLNVGVGGLRTGVFNVADLAITTGVVLLFVARRRTDADVSRSAVP